MIKKRARRNPSPLLPHWAQFPFLTTELGGENKALAFSPFFCQICDGNDIAYLGVYKLIIMPNLPTLIAGLGFDTYRRPIPSVLVDSIGSTTVVILATGIDVCQILMGFHITTPSPPKRDFLIWRYYHVIHGSISFFEKEG